MACQQGLLLQVLLLSSVQLTPKLLLLACSNLWVLKATCELVSSGTACTVCAQVTVTDDRYTPKPGQ